MGLFGKSKKQFEDLHNDLLFNDDDDYISPLRRTEHRTAAPHALTVDEVIGTETIPMKHGERPQSGSVYESMREHQKSKETGFDDNYVPSWAASKTDAINISAFTEPSKIEMTEEETEQAAKRAEEILKNTNARTETVEPTIPIDTGARVDLSASEPAQSDAAAAFLLRCKQAVNGNLTEETTPEVIAMEPSAEPTEEPLKQEEKIDAEPEEVKVNEPKAVAESILKEDDDVKIADKEENHEVKVEVEVIPSNVPAEIMHSSVTPATDTTVIMPPVTTDATVIMPSVTVPDVKIYGRVIGGKAVGQTPDGNIELSELIKAQKEEEARKKAEAMDSTRMFDGLDDIISQKADDSFDASSSIYHGDSEENDEYEEDIPYYETEDDSLTFDEYKNINDAARLRTASAERIAKETVKTSISFIVFGLLLLLSLPILDLLPVTAGGIISIVLTAVSLGVSSDIFKEFKNISEKPSFDICVAAAGLLGIVQTAVSAFVYNGELPFLAAAVSFLIAVNRAVKLKKEQRLAKGLQIIATSDPKNAIKIADQRAANVMASGAVEGEVAGLCAVETVNVQNFVKNSSYKSPFDLRVKTLFFVGLAASAAMGLVGGLLASAGVGITLALAVMLCVYSASALLSAEMPMNRIANRLFDKGAAIAGFKGAYDINLSNVIAVNTSDLFPEGSVKLYNMKTLGENEIGQTLTAAAAVAIAAKSPLAGIFRDMVGVSIEGLPKVNGVQYEDKMGISGWIGDNTVLIGNRNLMQGHSVPVPPATVDQKILKAGYFPVYIACKGVPCLLFVVKYEADPEIAFELKKICDTGMTVLVNPQDPNASDAMICDYFGIPDDALKSMNHNGRVFYDRQIRPCENLSAPAVYGRDVTGYFSAVTSGVILNSIIAVLTAVFIISAALGTVLLLYLAIMGKLSVVTAFAITAYQSIFMIISAIAAKVKDK